MEEYSLRDVIYDWDGTNYTMYNDSLVLMMNFDNVSALGENNTYAVDASKYGNDGTVTTALVNTTDKDLRAALEGAKVKGLANELAAAFGKTPQAAIEKLKNSIGLFEGILIPLCIWQGFPDIWF